MASHPRKGASPHIPTVAAFFVRFMPRMPPSIGMNRVEGMPLPQPCNPCHQKKEHSLLVLPFVNTIINFATKLFEMFTKKQSEHPQTVFQVFQVFQVFHFAFGPQNRPFLVQIRTNPKNRYSPTSAIKWVRKTPKKAIHPLVYIHVPVRQAIGVVFFRRSRLFFREATFFPIR